MFLGKKKHTQNMAAIKWTHCNSNQSLILCILNVFVYGLVWLRKVRLGIYILSSIWWLVWAINVYHITRIKKRCGYSLHFWMLEIPQMFNAIYFFLLLLLFRYEKITTTTSLNCSLACYIFFSIILPFWDEEKTKYINIISHMVFVSNMPPYNVYTRIKFHLRLIHFILHLKIIIFIDLYIIIYSIWFAFKAKTSLHINFLRPKCKCKQFYPSAQINADSKKKCTPRKIMDNCKCNSKT